MRTIMKARRQPERSLAPAVFIAAIVCFGVASPVAMAQQPIKNPIAVFNGLDKITGRIVSFEVGIDETVQFGSLQLTPRACHTRPATETPNTTAFLEVDEVGVEGKPTRLFTGWVFAASPGLHGIEHPVYDIWLTDCARTGAPVQTQAPSAESDGETPAGQPAPDAPPLPPRRPDFPATIPENMLPPPGEPLPQDPLFSPLAN